MRASGSGCSGNGCVGHVASPGTVVDFPLSELPHRVPIDPRWIVRFSRPLATSRSVDAALRSLGAPDDCYAVSTDAAIDGRSVLLAEALRRAMYPTATLVSAIG